MPAYLVRPVGEKEVRQWVFGKSAFVICASGATLTWQWQMVLEAASFPVGF